MPDCAWTSMKSNSGAAFVEAVTVRVVVAVVPAVSVTFPGVRVAPTSPKWGATVRAIVPLNPPWEVSVMVALDDCPALSWNWKTLEEREKSGPVTLSSMKAVCERPFPAVPVTNTGVNPGGLFAGTCIVSVDLTV